MSATPAPSITMLVVSPSTELRRAPQLHAYTTTAMPGEDLAQTWDKQLRCMLAANPDTVLRSVPLTMFRARCWFVDQPVPAGFNEEVSLIAHLGACAHTLPVGRDEPDFIAMHGTVVITGDGTHAAPVSLSSGQTQTLVEAVLGLADQLGHRSQLVPTR